MNNQSQKTKWWEFLIGILGIIIIVAFVVWLAAVWCDFEFKGCWSRMWQSTPCDPDYEDCGPAGTYPAYEYGD